MPKKLGGKRIPIIVESKFISKEIEAYKNAFSILGAEVTFASRIWDGDYGPGNPHWKSPMFLSDLT